MPPRSPNLIKLGVDLETGQAEREMNAMLDRIASRMRRGGFTSVGQLRAAGGLADMGYPAKGMEQLAKGAKAADDAIGNIGATSSRVSVRLSSFLAYRGFVYLEQGAINTTRALIDLDHQVRLIQTQLPNFGKGMQDMLMQGIIDVARETGQSFQDIADAEYQIVSAGVEASESLRVLRLTAEAATAGGTDLSTAFNGALSQLSAFGMEMSELEHVFDLQFNLVKRGIFNYQQLSTVVGITAEAFEQAGQSLETQNAALAAISQVFTGPQLARGATSLRAFVLAVAGEPEAFRRIGVETRDAAGEIRDLIPILDDLKQSFAGLPSGEQAERLKEILPDMRQRAGVLSLLSTLDDLKRNYIEQKLAIGDLHNAYEVVEGDVKMAGQQLANSIRHGFQPFADAVGTGIVQLNKLEKGFPGVTAGIIEMGVAVGGLAVAFNLLARSQANAGMASAAMGANATNFLLRNRGAISGVLVGATAGATLGANNTQGPASAPGAAGFLGTVGAGAGAGLLMGAGPWGAAAGASLGAVTYLFTSLEAQSKERARKAARSFTDAFAEELEKTGGDAARALERVQAARAGKERGEPTAQEVLRGGRQRLPYGAGERETLLAAGGTMYQGGFGDSLPTNSSAIWGLVGGYEVDVMRYVQRALAEAQAEEASVLTNPQIALEFGGNADEISRVAEQAFTARLGSLLEGIPAAGELETDLQQLQAAIREQRVSAEDTTSLLQTLANEGVQAFGEKLNLLGEDTKLVATAFEAAASKFEFLSKGDFGLASNVFANLGEEGMRLSGVFNELAKTVNAFEAFESIKNLTTYSWQMPSNPDALEAPQWVPELVSSNMLEGLGLDSNVIAQLLKDHLVSEMSALTGGGGITEGALVEVLLGPTRPIELGANSLAESLLFASEGFRHGFFDSNTGFPRILDSMGYTADELEMLGEEFQELNKTVAKVGLLKELQGIGEFLGLQPGFLDPVIQQLYESARVGGQSLISLLQDPTRLADLLANIEFSDVKIDQSQNNNIVIRIDGNMDTASAASAADQIIQEINERARQRSS